jgi:hypothetical protein
MGNFPATKTENIKQSNPGCQCGARDHRDRRGLSLVVLLLMFFAFNSNVPEIAVMSQMSRSSPQKHPMQLGSQVERQTSELGSSDHPFLQLPWVTTINPVADEA